MDEKVHLVESLPDELPLLEALTVLDLAPSTWYYHQNYDVGSSESPRETEAIKEDLDGIIRDHPGYGYRRIKPEYEERTGEVINHKRLLRLLKDTNLALLRNVNQPGPNPIKQILNDHAGHLNLVEGLDPALFEMVTTDFTEFRWNNGSKKAWLMVLLEQVSRLAVGWAVSPSRNRALAGEAWEQMKQTYKAFR